MCIYNFYIKKIACCLFGVKTGDSYVIINTFFTLTHKRNWKNVEVYNHVIVCMKCLFDFKH